MFINFIVKFFKKTGKKISSNLITRNLNLWEKELNHVVIMKSYLLDYG